MSLSQKTLVIVSLTVVGLVAVLYAASRVLLVRSALRLEQTDVRNAVERAQNALQDDLSSLSATANDYAAWDQTYAFMQHPSATHIRQEFENDTLQGLNVNFVLLITTEGKIVFSKSYDFLHKRETEFPLEAQRSLASDSWVRQAGKSLKPLSGMLMLPQGAVLIAACPILTTQRKGPAQGVLVMTRNLDQARIDRLTAITRISLRIHPYSPQWPEPTIQKVQAQLESNQEAVAVDPLSDTKVAGYTLLRDVHHRPILVLALEAPRTTFGQELQSLHYLLGALFLASAAFGLMIVFLLRRSVLAQLTCLSQEVGRVERSKNLSERITITGSTELAELGGAINKMLEALQKSENHFRYIADNINQVFWIRDAETQEIAYAGLAYETVWGRSRESLYSDSRSWRDAVHCDDRRLVAEMLQQQSRGKIGAAQYRIVRPDGSIRWVRDRYFPVSNEQGLLEQVAGLAEDITEFKKAEEVLLRSQEELEGLVRERTVELDQANISLRREVAERKQAERALEENVRLAQLGAVIGAALTKAKTLRAGLQQSAEAFVGYLDAAFARVWTLNESTNMLELEASAGMYTHINGPHGRMPVGGRFKIGKIAQLRQPHLTNDVQHDPEVSDHEWARREGMIAFAGCPLVVEGRTVGVVAAFACKPLTRAALDCFTSVADQIAQFIQRMRTQEALHASEEHFRQLFATIPVPVWLYDESSLKFLEVNDAAVEHYGYSREEFLKMTIKDFCPPEELERSQKYLSQPPSQKSTLHGCKHRTKDGRLIEVEISSHQVRFTGVSAVLVAAQDVTERNQMEVELRHGQKLQAVGALAAGIAHEINTPIQFVGDNVRFLHDAFADLITLLEKHEQTYDTIGNQYPSELRKEIQAAREAADIQFLRKEIPTALDQTLDGVGRVATIVQALKKFSHVEWGNEKTAANLNDAIESTLVVARNELKYVADVETAFADLPPVMCHLGDLNQVFLNLLVNAAHSIGEIVAKTGKKGRIRVETKEEGESVVVAISDTGAGIPPEIRSRIFEPFFTTKGVGKGTGQGLALARAVIVEKHGGSLTFESEVGKGSTFCIRIPFNATADEHAKAATRGSE